MKQQILESLNAYQHGCRPVGGFLRAVLENDLTVAVLRADHDNAKDLCEIVRYLWYEFPMNIWGSPAAYQRHIELGKAALPLAYSVPDDTRHQ